MALSVAQQRDLLLHASSDGLMRGLQRGLAVLAVLLVLAAIVLRGAMFFFLGLFCGVVSLSAAQSIPHLRHARRALTEGQRSPGQVTLQVEPGTDSPTYTAIVTDPTGQPWQMTFLPQGWTPQPGTVPVELFMLDGVAWPVLLLAAEGLIVPRQTPTRTTGERS